MQLRKKKSPSIFFALAFLLLISSLRILPILGLRSSQSLSSYGTVKYAGFIRVAKQLDGTWLFIDKNGNPFYSLGATAIRYDNRPNYKDNIIAKYGLLDAWGNATIEKLKSWSFNTIGCWSLPEVLRKGLPYCTIIDIGWYAHEHGIPLNRFNVPDPFDPQWPTRAREAAQSLITSDLVNDETFMGYFIANDLWFARWSPIQNDTYNEAMFNGDIDNLLKNQADQDSAKARLIELNYDYHQWLREYAELYYKYASEAIRSVDPNHLILGARGLSIYLPQEDLEAAGKYLDVISINFYQYLEYGSDFQKATRDTLQKYYTWSERPIMISEWSVRSNECDQDVTNVIGAGPVVDTQVERGEYYNKTLSELSALPFIVGMHWFMWTDKIVGGENSNYGLVNVNDDPYEFISNVKDTNLAVLKAKASN